MGADQQERFLGREGGQHDGFDRCEAVQSQAGEDGEV